MQLGLKLLQWLHVEYILWNFPPTKHTSVHPHHAKSSNNSAEPDLNQNLNLTARCPSHDPTHLSDSDLLPSYFKLTFLSTSSCQKGSLWDVERKKKRRGMNRDSGSVAERDWWNKKLKEPGGVGWRKKYECYWEENPGLAAVWKRKTEKNTEKIVATVLLKSTTGKLLCSQLNAHLLVIMKLLSISDYV